MDANEATRIVFSRIQNIDPDNVAKIMGLLLIQEHGEKEIIRLAFGPETLLHSVVLKVRKEIGLFSFSSPATPSSGGASAAVFSRQNSDRIFRLSPQTEEIIDELKLQSHFSFLNEGGSSYMKTTNSEPFYSDMTEDCHSLGAGGEDIVSKSLRWGLNGLSHCRNLGAIGDVSSTPGGFGWRHCLYFARGFCKNGNTCRFLHDDSASEQELLLRTKSSKLMASSALYSFPPSPFFPSSPSSYSAKYASFLQHQFDDKRAAAGAAASVMLNGGDDARQVKLDFTRICNPGSRQIYLTFPADSGFREEDVSNYFSIYGPVLDVRIPYQQKRMFGFVTFVFPETVKLILAKGNPHFVCDARVLVKPYKEKGKVLDKKQQQADLLDFSSSWTSSNMDYPLDIGKRSIYSISDGGLSAESASLLRRRMNERQQAEFLQKAIEMQERRFQLLDLKPRGFVPPFSSATATTTLGRIDSCFGNGVNNHEEEMQQQQQSMNNNARNKVDSALESSPKKDTDFRPCEEHSLPDSPFASPTKASSFSLDLTFSATSGIAPGSGENHLIGTSLLPLNSCFFKMPTRFSSGHGAVGT